MKIDSVGPSNKARSIPFDAQKTYNYFAVVDPKGREPEAFYGRPGLRTFAEMGAGSIRGGFKAGNNRTFFVSGATLYELSFDGTYTVRGILKQSSGVVQIDENQTQMGVCDGQTLYVFTYETNTFAEVTDTDFPGASSFTAIDSYFIVSKPNSGEFYISNVTDGTAWDALDFASAESSPDGLVRVYSALGQLWLFGDKTTEIYSNTGAALFPFERIQNVRVEMGCLAPNSVVEIDNSVFWLGRDKNGQGMVFRAQGFTPKRISTDAVDYVIQKADRLEEVRAWSFQQDGHIFVVFTGGGLETSQVYDLTTQVWVDWTFFNEYGRHEQHLGSCHVAAFGKNLVGSRIDGKVYEMRMDTYTDDGEEICAQRVFTHISNENQPQRYRKLELLFENGVGNADAPDPKCMIEISGDLARTWSNVKERSLGKVGEYEKPIEVRRLGAYENLTFRVTVTDPVKKVMIGAYLT